jgi:hypothetical protein
MFNIYLIKGDNCRALTITQIHKGKALTNHTIRTIHPIEDARICRIQCFLEPLCFTYNFCHKQGDPVCELTNSDHIRHEKDLVGKAGCTYYGSEVWTTVDVSLYIFFDPSVGVPLVYR